MMRFGAIAAVIVLYIASQAEARGRRYVVYPVYPYPGVIVAPVLVPSPAIPAAMPSPYFAPFGSANAAPALPQAERFVRIENKSGEKLTVSLLCRTRDERGRWTWLPEDPDPQGLRDDFQHRAKWSPRPDRQDLGQSGAIWAQSATQKWADHQSRDLLLVPEPEGYYLTSRMETFTHTFRKK